MTTLYEYLLAEIERRIEARLDAALRPFYESASLLSARLDAVEEIVARMVEAAITTDPELVAELRVRLETLQRRGAHRVYLH